MKPRRIFSAARLAWKLAAVIAAMLATSAAHAATIVYNFNDTIAFGANLGTGSPVTTNGFSGDGITLSNWTASSTVRTIGVQSGQVRALKSGDTDTHAFTITIPDLGSQTLELTSLFFNYGNVGADTSPANFLVSSNRVGGTFTNNPATHAAGPASTSVTMLLGGTFSSINNTSITFTLNDSAGGDNKNTTLYTFIDNVTLTGTLSSIPEPSVALLSAFGMFALILRRRR